MPAAATRADAIRAKIASVEIRHLHAVGTVPGVVVLQAAARNGPGAGALVWNTAEGSLAWRAPGSSVDGPPVPIDGDGVYLLEDGHDPNKWLRVQVYESYLSPTYAASLVHLADRYANGPPGDDVTAAEALAGDVETWTIDLVNESAEAITGLVAWLDGVVEFLEISANGSDWVAPTTEATALALGDLVVSASATLHVRRTIPAVEGFDPSVLTHFHIAWNAF